MCFYYIGTAACDCLEQVVGTVAPPRQAHVYKKINLTERLIEQISLFYCSENADESGCNEKAKVRSQTDAERRGFCR